MNFVLNAEEEGQHDTWNIRGRLGQLVQISGRIILLLLALYTILGLLYAGLLSSAIEIRQEEWLELPSRFFGDFDKAERVLVDANTTARVPKSIDAEDDKDPLVLKPVQPRSFNRPKGCREVKVGAPSNAVEGLHCEYSDLWTIYPWIAEKGADAGMLGCKDALNEDSGVQGGSLLNADGTYGGNAVCLNGVTTNTVPTAQ
ncbi:hypothetical protein BSKO_00099 [Bryopsis sp. KO-2023]|nr:hypothetical protein BSKO_00099 [Bryopsis sp. KO-2023]